MFNKSLERLNRYLIKIKDLIRNISITNIKQSLKQELEVYKRKMSNLPETNFQLGLYHFEHGYINDAIFRFRLLKHFCKRYTACDYYLARCYIEKFQYDKAARFLTQYMQSGDKQFGEEAKYCDKLTNKRLKDIIKIPTSITIHNLNKAANAYKLDKKLPASDFSQKEFAILDGHLKAINRPWGHNILDIGSRFGIIGQLCRDSRIANIINGVEISSMMLDIANSLLSDDTKVYTHIALYKDFDLYFQNMQKYDGPKYDIVILSGLLPHFLDLELVFNTIKNFLSEDGLILLSFENSDSVGASGGNVELIQHTERFSYSRAYMKELISDNHFQVVEEQISNISQNQSSTVMLLKVAAIKRKKTSKTKT